MSQQVTTSVIESESHVPRSECDSGLLNEIVYELRNTGIDYCPLVAYVELLIEAAQKLSAQTDVQQLTGRQRREIGRALTRGIDAALHV